MRVYYNDSDPFVCVWLRNLIAAKLLPAGDVDERPIEQVQASDVAGYAQAHFFAGVGGWPYALQLAGWGDRAVWTGSCPCQPLSGAGQRQGHADSRHLWPAFYGLIAQCKPSVVFGEQVASKDGREWLAAVRADLEGAGYACGAADLPAASAGAPHIRQRLWFVAHAPRDLRRAPRHEGCAAPNGRRASQAPTGADVGGERLAVGIQGTLGAPTGNAQSQRLHRARREGWATEPNVERVANGVPNRVGKIRGLGNAIVPQVAAAFVSAYMDVVGDRGGRMMGGSAQGDV